MKISLNIHVLTSRTHRNIIEAASAGAAGSVKVVAGIAVHVIAFLSILKFVDATLTWFGELVEVEGLTLEVSFPKFNSLRIIQIY